ncbi:f-box protein [Nicotiana attenuata]|uniref:F-box protein n=1 Tax=Nicotiana attenuata TaxID=49451 RepID=A0A314L5X6_NICAT|nr:f-box protein [Nicotiana attenuata]
MITALRKMYEVTIMDLPRVIMVELFCKTVCKLWYNLLTCDPLFVNMYHTSRSLNFHCILLSVDHSFVSLLELKADYDYYSSPLNRPMLLSPKFHLPPLESRTINLASKPKLEIIGSCNGFICLMNSCTYGRTRLVYICNPLLGDCFKLKYPDKSVCHVAWGFCFSESSGQYKLLRSVWDRPELYELEVYTLGVDKKWRNVGEVRPHPRGSLTNVNVNGFLHWMDSENHKKSASASASASIYSFNIRTEEVKSVPPPPGLETPSSCLRLVELGNCVCLSDNSYSQHVDIWLMKEYGIAESWTKDRILMDCIPPDIRQGIFIPIIIWKDGVILMQSEQGTQLVSYSPKEKKFRKVNVYGSGIAVTKYVPSFYSLKTVMGDSFQVSNVYPKAKIV